MLTHPQQAQIICIIFVQCWTNVEDVGPTLYKWSTNVLCSDPAHTRYLLNAVSMLGQREPTLRQHWVNAACFLGTPETIGLQITKNV